MRIIGGNLKGHTLFAPKGRRLRPTSDHVKETLFNMLGQDIVHATFLDLFAGTGNIGIEALSRGAERAVFVEKDPSHVRALKRNLAACALESRSQVYRGDANKIVDLLQKKNWCFNVVFLDPPYRQTNMLSDMLRRVVDMALLAETGFIVAEHAHTFIPPSILGESFSLTKQRQIGDTALSFYHDEVNSL
jgi:16S rRNA (guanine(966)-N(2))-methyltransferase RsmD